MAATLPIDFQPYYLAEMVNLEMIDQALEGLAPADAVGELSILQFSASDPIQLSLKIAGRDAVHLNVRQQWLFSPAYGKQLHEALEQLFEGAK